MITHSLYVHIPFCLRKCLFCSFVITVGQEHRRDDYIAALLEEMKNYQNLKLKSIYLGGGTPSMLDEQHLEILMKAIKDNFIWSENMEITLEANPESINLAKAKLIRKIGFNRISLGVQSMNDRYLKFLGRGHQGAKAKEVYQMLRDEGFENINLDLMYAFPGQTTQELEEDVCKIASLKSEHLSLYTLTIEPNSRFHATHMKLDDDEKLAEQYLLIGRLLGNFGFQQYEISNFAKPGFQSVHNRNYWLGDPYIGLGMGAHGFTGCRRYWNASHLQNYLEQISSQGQAIEGFEDLTEEQLMMEKVLFGLRMNQGIAWNLVPKTKQEQIKTWIDEGLLLLEDGFLKTTDRGRLVLDELSVRLI